MNSFYLTISAFVILFGLSCMTLILFSQKLTVFWVMSQLMSNVNFVDFSLIVDKKSVMFSCLVLLISSGIFSFMYYYMDLDNSQVYFYFTVALFVLSMLFLIYGGSMLSLILGWDGLGVVSYLLVIYYSSASSSNSGMITFLSNRVGDVFFIACIVFVASGFNLDCWDNWSFYLMAPMLFLCFITKSAQFPFSSWLPAAMAAPTPVSALVHSSTLVTAGVFMLIRFNLSINNSVSQLLFMFGLLTSFYAGVMALVETDLKKVIALSTLSQLGFMFISLGLGMVWMAFFHMLTHAIFKASLFFASGIFIHNMGSAQDYRSSFNFYNSAPLLSSVGMITTFCLIGFPFSVGFYSKDLILDLFNHKSYNFILHSVFMLIVFLTLIYMFRFCYLVFWMNSKMSPVSVVEENQLPNLKALFNFMTVLIVGGAMIVMNFNAESPMIFSPGWKLSYLMLFIVLFVMLISVKLVMKTIDFNNFMMSKMSFLTYFTSQVSQEITWLLPKQAASTCDKGWLEYWGGQGLNFMMINSGIFMNWIMIFMAWAIFIPMSAVVML